MQTSTDYKIRQLAQGDHDAVASLWSMAFGPPFQIHDPVNYIETLSYLVGAFSDGALVAASGVIDFDLHFEGQWLKAGGLAAVATDPSHRRRGAVGMLLKDCVQHLHDRKVAISTLWPFNYKFYERFGWLTTDMQYEAQIKISGMHKLGNARNYKLTPLEKFETVLDTHQKWCEQYNMAIVRTKHMWKRWLFRPDFHGRLFKHPDGYMIFDLSNSKDRVLSLREWAYLTEEAFMDGLALIGQTDSQFQQVKWTDGRMEPLLKLNMFDAFENVQLKPGMMSRVTNIEALAEALDLPLTDYPVRDPLGVCTQNVSGNDTAMGPGELMHMVCGSPADPSIAQLPLTRRSFSAVHY